MIGEEELLEAVRAVVPAAARVAVDSTGGAGECVTISHLDGVSEYPVVCLSALDGLALVPRAEDPVGGWLACVYPDRDAFGDPERVSSYSCADRSLHGARVAVAATAGYIAMVREG